jgi:hypothetical protein
MVEVCAIGASDHKRHGRSTGWAVVTSDWYLRTIRMVPSARAGPVRKDR